MGGTVAETIRKSDGTIIKMARRTGAYNWMFFSPEFCEGKIDEAINEHIKSFFEMKQDFEKGEPYQFPMTPVYAWCNETAPVDYGLVVIDFQNKKIHSMQGFDCPGEQSFFGIMSDQSMQDRYQHLFDKNLLDIYFGNQKLGDVHSLLGEKFQIDGVDVYHKNNFKNIFLDKSLVKDVSSVHFLRMKPRILHDFQIIRYANDPESSFLMIQNLMADGFSFNKQEQSMWLEDLDSYDLDSFTEHSKDDLISKLKSTFNVKNKPKNN